MDSPTHTSLLHSAKKPDSNSDKLKNNGEKNAHADNAGQTIKQLPISIQTCSELIHEGYLYVDKTVLIYRLVMSGKAYFMSRPRRFGKSLLLSTLESLFRGEQALFAELWLGRSNWVWKHYPVVRVDFIRGKVDTPENCRDLLWRSITRLCFVCCFGCWVFG